MNSINQFSINVDHSRDELIRIFTEADEKNETGVFSEFVKASMATTHSYKNRLTRIRTLIEALQKP